MNKKFKSISARILFLMDFLSPEETIEHQKSVNHHRDLNRTFRKMMTVNVLEIDPKIRKKCVNLSYDLEYMNSADRLAFMYDDPSFPKNEKILMLTTCISIMEQIEEYEVCSTLNRMRQYLHK